MKLHILSDIHLEFERFAPPPTAADVVVLAGDIWLGPRGVEWAARTFERPVLYIAGNHEYYGGHFPNTLTKMRRVAQGSNVSVLDAEQVVLGGVRFLAATLWTDFAITGNAVMAQLAAQQAMTDYSRIRAAAYRHLRPSDTREAHRAAGSFLRAALAQPFDGPTVVVTHHAPSPQSIAARFLDNPTHLNAAYASDLEDLMGPPVALWVHGHTHSSADYWLNGTRVVCNPRGYIPYEPNPQFDPGLVVEIAG
jgi:predicted phosphodiesterase